MTAREMAASSGLSRERVAYTLRETEKYTGISYWTLRREVLAGRLAPMRLKGRHGAVLVSPESVDRWIEVACE